MGNTSVTTQKTVMSATESDSTTVATVEPVECVEPVDTVDSAVCTEPVDSVDPVDSDVCIEPVDSVDTVVVLPEKKKAVRKSPEPEAEVPSTTTKPTKPTMSDAGSQTDFSDDSDGSGPYMDACVDSEENWSQVISRGKKYTGKSFIEKVQGYIDGKDVTVRLNTLLSSTQPKQTVCIFNKLFMCAKHDCPFEHKTKNCIFHLKSECNNSECSFRHDPKLRGKFPDACVRHFTGRCLFGNDCRNIHRLDFKTLMSYF